MKINNTSFNIEEANYASFRSEKTSKQPLILDTRSQLLQNQESPTPCCLSSCLIKIKDLFVALFSWLFCCKSESSETIAKQKLKSVITDLQDREVLAFAETVLGKLEEIDSVWKQFDPQNEHETIRKSNQLMNELPEYYFNKRTDIYFPDEVRDYKNRLMVMHLAQKITHESYTQETLEQELQDTEAKLDEKAWITLSIRMYSDSNKSTFEKVLLSAYEALTNDSFEQFLERLGIKQS